MVRLSMLLLFCAFTIALHAQEKKAVTDSMSIRHSPVRATIMSAILPGAGQVYNKKYWKVPVIYAGFGTLGYLFKVNNDDYKIYKEAYRNRLDGDPSTVDQFVDIYQDQDLVTLKNFYRRNRDLCIIGGGVLYILNIIDAAVDAHLFYFNVSDDLSMRLQPGMNYGIATGPCVNINIQF